MAKKPTKKELAAQEKAAKEAAAKAEAEAQAQQGPMLSVLAQYTKDQSFENPNAPDSLRSGLAPLKSKSASKLDAKCLKVIMLK